MKQWIYAGKMALRSDADWAELRDQVVTLYGNPVFRALGRSELGVAIMEDFPPIDPWYSKLISRELSLETIAWSLDRTGTVPRPKDIATGQRELPRTRPFSMRIKPRDYWRIMRAALVHRFESERYDAIMDRQLALAVVDDDADRRGFAEPHLVAQHLTVQSLEWRLSGNEGPPSPTSAP